MRVGSLYPLDIPCFFNIFGSPGKARYRVPTHKCAVADFLVIKYFYRLSQGNIWRCDNFYRNSYKHIQKILFLIYYSRFC